MADLHQKQRDEMDSDEFAVPSKRKLPMHDEHHVRLAWDMVSNTHGLSDEERAEARERIKRRAHSMGIDTTNWTVHADAIGLQAMSLAVPKTPGHPNKRPFSGILTRLDEPSDQPPHGTGERRVLLPREVAERALPSLLGMAVDFQPGLDGHDVARKIGVITEAHIEGNAIVIAGHLYAQDFPAEMRKIDAQKSALGFSFELNPTAHSITADNIYRVDGCVFTGAALLYKASAAYQTTSLAAAAEPPGDNAMELAEIMERLNTLAASMDELSKKVNDPLHATQACMAAVEPHAKSLEERADQMEQAGIGTHPTLGHVHALRHMAARMRAEAAMGKVPHIYQGSDLVNASASGNSEDDDMNKEVAEALSALGAQLSELKAEMAGFKTQVADVKAAAREASPAPARVTVPSNVTAMLRRFNLDATGQDGELISDTELAKAIRSAGLTPEQSIQIKQAVSRVRSGLAA